MKRALAVVLVCLLTACATAAPEPIRGTGVEADPPYGWIEYCWRHWATEPACAGYQP